jgi:hypothetical protein
MVAPCSGFRLPSFWFVTQPFRPWRIVESGVQGRYSEDDDEFTAHVTFRHDKSVDTTGIFTDGPE